MGCGSSSNGEEDKKNKEANVNGSSAHVNSLPTKPIVRPKQKNKEILTLFFGGAGVKIGEEFWNNQLGQNYINNVGGYYGSKEDTQNNGELISTYFNISEKDVCTPRTIFIDPDRNSIDSLKRSPLHKLFNQNNFANLKSKSFLTWNTGYYVTSNENSQCILDLVTKNAEKIDNMDGILMFDSLSGGTCGLADLFSSKICETAPESRMISISLTSGGTSDNPFAFYNNIFSLAK
jgi:hypothetical protein